MTDSVTYREKRRKDSVKKFLNGEARRPYVLREDISCGLKGQAINRFGEESKNINSSSCACQETLGKFAANFKSMLHTGPKLVNRASIQQPKTATKKYRDINQQNKWLLDNVFDSYGNYLFCFSCIKNILDVGGKRLHRLREIKRQQANAPTIRVRKDHVATKQTCDVVPPATVTNVLAWWTNLEDSSIIELHNPPKLHHGKSNNSKEALLAHFLEFIDYNSQPNGRRVGSHGPLFFLNSKFDRINAPSASKVGKPEQWKRRSLVYEYNRTIEDNKSISNGTAKKWLKTYRPKHTICPKKTDYCEMCVECQEQKRRHETISMRLQQEGNGNEEEIRENKALAESYGLLLEEHRVDAANELGHYRQKTNKSRSLYHYIEELQKKESKSKEEKAQLQKLKSQITFSFSLDYQQSKLTPFWGFSAQPSETYYLRKLSHNIFGIVDHTLAQNAVYVVDERTGGAKNADMTISLVDHYIHQQIPFWARHLCLFMDNGATNKNQFMIQWAMELVERSDYDTIRMCFFVPGHGKNDADRLFSRISHAFNNNDVFVTEHLLKLIRDTLGPSDKCIHASSCDIVNWKGLLTQKYTSLKEIQCYRDFLIKRNTKGRVVVYHKKCGYAGEYVHKELLKKNVDVGLDLTGEAKSFTYEAKGMSPGLSKEKVADLVKMYDRFIDPILRPKWLPASHTITAPRVTTSSPSSELAREHRAALKKRNKDKKVQNKVHIK
jgi:CRISPR/Cas system CSM-associated protein Csm2 small subunit